MKSRSMREKIVLVTGGTKGIGRETAKLFGNHGARIFICGRSTEALERSSRIMGEEGIIVTALQTDVRDPEACRLLIQKIEDEAGRLDVVINNAGMSMRGSLEETDPEVIRTMAEVNYLGAAYITHYAIPLLKASGGSVVFVSSLSALHGLPGIGPYGATKLALQGLAQSARSELFQCGVHVGIVHVGFTENDPEKVVYSRDGSLIPLYRPRNSQTQRETAEDILTCVVRRKREMTLTPLGRIAGILYRFFPGLSDVLVRVFVKKSKMYGQR